MQRILSRTSNLLYWYLRLESLGGSIVHQPAILNQIIFLLINEGQLNPFQKVQSHKDKQSWGKAMWDEMNSS